VNPAGDTVPPSAQQQPPWAACCGWLGRIVDPFSDELGAAPDGSCESIKRVLMSLAMTKVRTWQKRGGETGDVPCKSEEGLLNTLVDLGGSLHEFHAKLCRKLASLFLGDCSLVAPVTLVADEDLVHPLRGVLLNVRMPRADV
jgi:hypothetical protein